MSRLNLVAIDSSEHSDRAFNCKFEFYSFLLIVSVSYLRGSCCPSLRMYCERPRSRPLPSIMHASQRKATHKRGWSLLRGLHHIHLLAWSSSNEGTSINWFIVTGT